MTWSEAAAQARGYGRAAALEELRHALRGEAMPVTDHSETLGDGVSPRDELMLMMMCFFQILDVYLYYNICILYTHIFINIYIYTQ